MEDNLRSSVAQETQQKGRFQNNEIPNGKLIQTNSSLKKYRVTVRYLPLKEEEAQIKRGIIETVMKKPVKK